MEFDAEYFLKLHGYINNKFTEGVIYEIADWADDADKFLFHLQYYIDATCNVPHKGWKHIELVDLTESEIMAGANFSAFVVCKLYDFDFQMISLTEHCTPSAGVREFLKKHPYRIYQ